MALITCEINLTLIWPDRCFIKDISNTNQKPTLIQNFMFLS